MIFIDGPNDITSVKSWETYLERLNTLNPHDRIVVSEKARAKRNIALLLELEKEGKD